MILPNWCFSTLKIYDEEPKLKNLMKLIEDWTSEDAEPNGFGTMWLGNIVLHSGVGSVDDNKKEDFLSCRGSVDHLELQNDCIYIQMTTAWSPCFKMWKKNCTKILKQGL